MRQAKNKTETFIGLFSFCKKFNLPYWKLRYRIIKCRMRIFRFNGISYVEKENLKEILSTYKANYLSNVDNAIDYLNQRS